MRKKYFLAKLAIFGFLALGTATTFVGCKDYDDDITQLQTEIDANKADYTSVLTTQLAAVNTQITTLQGSQAALQASVTTAQTAATAAKTSADAAAAAAAAAQLAAAQAKLDAINTAAAALANTKADLETRIATLEAKFDALKATAATKDELTALNTNLLKEIANAKSAIEAQIVTISAKIDAVDAKYNTLTATLATKSEVQAAIQTLNTQIEAVYLQKATFDAYKVIVTTQFADLQASIATINGKIAANTANIAALETKLADLKTQLTAAIATAKAEAITAAVAQATTAAYAADAQQAVTLKAMWEAYVNTSLDKYVKKADYDAKMAEIKTQLEALSTAITAIDARLNTMNAIFSHRLASMAFVPEFYVGGIPTIIFSTLYYTDLDQAAPKTTLSTSMKSQAKYRLNPNGVMLADVKDFVYTGEKAETRGLGTDPAAPISVVDKTLGENGLLTLNVAKTANFAASPKFDIVSLKATLADKALTSAEKEAGTSVAVYSEYVRATEVALNEDKLNIAKKNALSYHYKLTQPLAQDVVTPEASFVYNSTLDLNTIVASCYLVGGTDHTTFNESAYGLKYRFAMAPDAYNVSNAGVTTNQQNFASVTADGTMTAKVYQDAPLAAAAGRTPIVKVELVDAQNHVVKRAFIKVKISANKAADIVVNYTENIVLGCGTRTFKIDVEKLNREVYNKIPMSHAQFWGNYTNDGTSVTIPVTATPQIVQVGSGSQLSTEVHWVVPEIQFGAIPAAGKDFIATLRVIPQFADTDLPDVVFKFAVNVVKPAVSIVGKELTYWTADQSAFKVNVAVPASNMDNNPNNCIYEADLTNAFNKDGNGNVKLNNATTCGALKFVLVSTNPSTAAGFSVTGDMIKLSRTTANAATLNALDAGTLSVKVKAYYEWNGNTVDLMTFTVQFIKPLSLNVTTDHSFTDGATGGSKIYYFNYPNPDVSILVKDWRDVTVQGFTALWSFYGLDGIPLDTNNAKTNLKEVNGNLVPTDGFTTGHLPTDVILSTGNDMGGSYVKYFNNGTPLTMGYDLFIPVSITHKWGTLNGTLKVQVNKLGTVTAPKK